MKYQTQQHLNITILSLLEKCKSKLQMRYYLTSVIIPIIKKSTNDAGEDVEKRDPCCTVGGNVN